MRRALKICATQSVALSARENSKGSVEAYAGKSPMSIANRCVALAIAVVAVMVGLCAPAWSDSVSLLDTVRKRGQVVCGVSEHAPGFSDVDARGKWSGLDIEFCSA